MGSGSMQVARILGIRIGVNYSWFAVLFLFIFLLSGSFADALGGDRTGGYLCAVAASLLFFGSILLHELGHALAARRAGIEVAGIDLFFFGGLMKMSRDTDSPGAELKVGIAGPLVTLAIVVAGTGLATLLAGGWSEFWDQARLAGASAGAVDLVLSFLVSMNVLLLALNLMPAFPLDGGRVARAIAWKVTGDRARATRFAATLGRAFAWLLIAGGLALLLSGHAFDGLWLMVVGWMLGGSARAAVLQTDFAESIAHITVADIMDSEPVAIPAGLDAHTAYEDFFLRYGYDWFVVCAPDGRPAGVAQRPVVEQAALHEGSAAARTPVGRLAVPHEREGEVPADTPLESLLGSRPLRERGALLAVDGDGRLRGVVTVEQVARALQGRLATT